MTNDAPRGNRGQAVRAAGCLLSALLLLAQAAPVLGGEVQFSYASALSGTGAETGRAIARDASGNVYVTGAFEGTVDFDPGPGTFNLSSAGARDSFVCKLDGSGALVWAKQLGGAGDDVGNGIALDANGNVLTTGTFSGIADFDPGSGVQNLVSQEFSADVFVSKLDANGAFVWARQLGGFLDDEGNAITTDGNGNVYVTGGFRTFGATSPEAAPRIAPPGNLDIFVSKFDPSGTSVWTSQMGGFLDDVGRGIAVDAAGNVYTTGYFSGTADLDPGQGFANLVSAGGTDLFASKLDANGAFVWARQMGGTGNDAGNGLALDATASVHLTGSFSGSADLDPGAGIQNLVSAGGTDSFVCKLDSGGNFVWARQLGGAGDDSGNAIAIAGNVYTSGSFSGSADFDPGSGTQNLTAAGGSDVFVSNLDATGAFVWAKPLGGAEDDLGNGISADAAGNVYTTGSFRGSADFDPGTAIRNLVSAGGTDAFVSRLAPVPVPQDDPVPPNRNPTILSGPSANPNPTTVCSEVTFSLSASDPDNDKLAYAWDLGDGTTAAGPGVVHEYEALGNYTVTVTVTDGRGGSATGTVLVTIAPALPLLGTGPDSDGDGVSDSLETFIGTDPLDCASSQVAEEDLQPTFLYVTRMLVQLKFQEAGQGHDRIRISGALALPTGFVFEGREVIVDIGGVQRRFTLDGTGSGVGPDGTGLRVTFSPPRRGRSVFKLDRAFLGDFQETLSETSGLANENLVGAARTVRITLLFNDTAYVRDLVLSYTASAGLVGTAKQTKRRTQ